MRAGIARTTAVAALAIPLLALAPPSASATDPATPSPAQPTLSNVDAPYITINICVHIPTPGSATLNWCWP
ncbi:hypothetical protein [Nocardia concava]|uniref:hypothetical protein n=1 Tax=Nocardia concava TaxID=257281 RepID=UPI0012FBCB49|nr:hypothetical protein [Nocardia concava]